MVAQMHRGQKGFTLVELLIVVAILGALAAIALPNVIQFIGSGTSEANSTELQTVQTAMDLYMTKTKVTTVTATVAAVTNFATSNPVLYPNYMRIQTPGFAAGYKWDVAGKVLPGP